KLENNGHRFYTQTDTEIIVHSYEEKGIDCVRRFNGEFAFALWDSDKKTLYLVRDRLGIRPLYYWHKGEKLIFASGIKPILLHPEVSKDLDPSSLDAYLDLRYIPGEGTMFAEIKRLPSASILTFRSGKAKIDEYWKIEVLEEARKDILEEFSLLLEDSVRLRMVSDVPLGCFLSGGVDSSTILSLMKKHSPSSLKTFSIGFGTDIDETDAARKVSKLFETDHQEIIIEKQSYNLLSEIVSFMDEPIGDAIIIPTYLLTKEASSSVKVVLTGEGADELLGGYIHHLAISKDGFRRLIPSSLIKLIPTGALSRFFPYPAALGERGKERLLSFLSVKTNTDKYMSFAQLFPDRGGVKGLFGRYLEQGGDPLRGGVRGLFGRYLEQGGDPLNSFIDCDLHYWLPDYILLKQDRLTMANSLEGRLPFLDHRLVELCAKIPRNLKIRGFSQKYLLRRQAERILPKEIAWAKKRAFYLPTEKCFEEDFHQYAKESLNSLAKRHLVDYNYQGINIKTKELLENKQIMALVILEEWMRGYIDEKD
ncbi:asparagine synthase (glutamine-hydrolyzing), partial [bacterium]|nr:asparagine synthase (glutamine-hydrolyzing) [bacterium]